MSGVDGLESGIEGGFDYCVKLGRVDMRHVTLGVALADCLETDAERLCLVWRLVVRELGPVKFVAS